jgi:hypothetical protein
MKQSDMDVVRDVEEGLTLEAYAMRNQLKALGELLESLRQQKSNAVVIPVITRKTTGSKRLPVKLDGGNDG